MGLPLGALIDVKSKVGFDSIRSGEEIIMAHLPQNTFNDWWT